MPDASAVPTVLEMPGGEQPKQNRAQTANTATILIRFCVAIDIVDDAYAGGRLVFDFFRFAFGGVAFADMVSPEDGGSGPFEA